MKRLLLLLILLSPAIPSFSQITRTEAIDSINRVLVTGKADTARVNALNWLSRLSNQAANYSKSMDEANEALALANKLHYLRGAASACNNKGNAYIQQGNYPDALKQYELALELRKKSGDIRSIARTYINIGNVSIQQGNYAEALKNYFYSLKMTEEIKDTGDMANCYVSIANVYIKQKNYDEALKNYFFSLKIYQRNNIDKHGIAMAYDDIGNTYAKQGNYNEALKEFLISISLQEKGGADSLLMASSYGNIGDVYVQQGKYNDALKSYLNALYMQKKMGYTYGIVNSYINLGKIYFKLNKKALAGDNLNAGLVLAKESGSKEEIEEAYLELSVLDSSTGNVSAAYQYFKLYSQLKDSLENEESDKQISQLKIQYETDKKDQQIRTQSLQINSQNLNLRNKTLQNRILQTSIAVGLMIIGVIFYLFFLRNKRRQREYEHMLTDLELTVLKTQLNPHFISNSLINIKAFIEKQPEKVDQFLSKFARLMRQVLEQNEKQLTSLKEELETAELYMQIESFKLKHGFDYRFNCDASVDPEMFMVPPLILQPLIENAVWHGLTYKPERGYIDINIKFEDDLLKFTIEDNGVGQKLKMQNENTRPNKKFSFGLSITNKRIKLLNKEFKGEGYFNLLFLNGRTVAEMALPSIQL